MFSKNVDQNLSLTRKHSDNFLANAILLHYNLHLQEELRMSLLNSCRGDPKDTPFIFHSVPLVVGVKECPLSSAATPVLHLLGRVYLFTLVDTVYFLELCWDCRKVCKGWNVGRRYGLRVNHKVPQGEHTCGLAKLIDEYLVWKESLQPKTQMTWA